MTEEGGYRKGTRNKPKKLPVFDPNPSGRFVHEVLKETGVNGVLIGRLAVWVWMLRKVGHPDAKAGYPHS